MIESSKNLKRLLLRPAKKSDKENEVKSFCLRSPFSSSILTRLDFSPVHFFILASSFENKIKTKRKITLGAEKSKLVLEKDKRESERKREREREKEWSCGYVGDAVKLETTLGTCHQ